jgi:adenosylcobinamide-GDP ribazoletransferase
LAGLWLLVYAAASWLWNAEIGIVLSMIASILITGAFHEDGFADVCGFGSGWTKTEFDHYER